MLDVMKMKTLSSHQLLPTHILTPIKAYHHCYPDISTQYQYSDNNFLLFFVLYKYYEEDMGKSHSQSNVFLNQYFSNAYTNP